MVGKRDFGDAFDTAESWYLRLGPWRKAVVMYALMLITGFSGAVVLDAALFKEFREYWGVWRSIVLPVVVFGLSYWVVMAFAFAEKRQRSAAPGGFPVAIGDPKSAGVPGQR